MNEMVNFEGMSPSELNMMQSRLIEAQMVGIQRELQVFKNDMLISQTKTEQEVNGLKDNVSDISMKFTSTEKELNNVKEIAITSNRVRNPRYGFVNQGDFGRMFNVSISSTRVGKLLKVTGIALVSKRKTTPKRAFIPKLAKTIASENYTSFQWNFIECMKKVDAWLEENDYYTDFYSIESEDDMNIFIDRLHEEYVK